MTLPLLPANRDYTTLDKASLDARVQALIQSAYPYWTDTARANFGNILNELLTFTGDLLAFIQNKQFREAFLCWAVQRKSMLARARETGFVPRGAVAAQVEETFTISTATSGDVVFAAGTPVRTKGANPKSFQALARVTIPAGSTSSVGTVEHSTNQTDTFTSDGTPGQQFDLTAIPYLDDSLALSWGGEDYTQVDDFFGSTATDKHYTLWADENGRARITLGDGVNGRVPSKDVVGEAAYKTGGGLAGNVEAHSLTAIDGSFFDEDDNPVVVTVDNAATPDVLGEDRMPVEAMRVLIPASVRARANCIAREDFETAALLVPGVARALMLTAVEQVGIPYNRGWLRIVPTGGGTPSSALKAVVLTGVTITYPQPVGFGVEVLDPLYQAVAFHMKLWPRAGYTAAEVAALIRATLALWFAPVITDVSSSEVYAQAAAALWGTSWQDLIGSANQLVNFGYYYKDGDGNPSSILPLSDLFDVVHDTAGVLRMGTALADFTLNGVHDDVALDVQKFPSLGAVEIVNGATGGLI